MIPTDNQRRHRVFRNTQACRYRHYSWGFLYSKNCVFPLVIRNVTKVLSNTVKQGYTREYRVPVYHKHPQLSYFSLERKNKEINRRLECLSEYSSSLFKI